MRKVLNPVTQPNTVSIYLNFITNNFHLPTHIRDYALFRLLLRTFQDDVKPRTSALLFLILILNVQKQAPNSIHNQNILP